MSSFLKPTEVVEDIDSALTFTSIYKIQDIVFHKIAETELSEQQKQEIFEALKKSQKIQSFDNNEAYYGYLWKQEGKSITITFDTSKKNQEIKKEDIVIDETKIKSPFLSGIFFEKVNKYDVIIEDKNVIIKLDVNNENWPCIIVDGDMDENSLLILGFLCKLQGLYEQFIILLTKGGIKSNLICCTSLGMYFAQNERVDECFYWFVKTYLISEDIMLFLFLFNILFEAKTRSCFVLLENMMIKLAKADVPEAYHNLGLIYLVEDFDQNFDLAKEYLQYAADHYNFDKSCQILGHLFISGKYFKKDIQEGIKYLKKSGLSDKDINEYLSKIAEETKNDDDESSILDYAIVITAAVGIAIGAYTLYKRFLRRK